MEQPIKKKQIFLRCQISPSASSTRDLGTRLRAFWSSDLGYSPQPKTTVQKSRTRISYKNLRYFFDKSAEKIDGSVLVLSPMLRLAISSALLAFVEYFLYETLQDNLPVVRAKPLGRSIKKTASFKKTTQLPRMSPIRSVIINRTTAKWKSYLLIASMITD